MIPYDSLSGIKVILLINIPFDDDPRKFISWNKMMTNPMMIPYDSLLGIKVIMLINIPFDDDPRKFISWKKMMTKTMMIPYDSMQGIEAIDHINGSGVKNSEFFFDVFELNSGNGEGRN